MITAALLLLAATPAIGAAQQDSVDWLSLAHGALPIAVEADPSLRVSMEQALRVVDGDGRGFSLTPRPGAASASVQFTYALPAATTFRAFHVPNVLETPSPSQTFVREVVVEGSADAATGPYVELASATLSTHTARNQRTTLRVTAPTGVRFVRVTLRGGIDVQRDATFLEFSELVGYGTQASVPLAESFTGAWRGRGVRLTLQQSGPVVTGCYDGEGRLSGTVAGRVLYATGATPAGIGSAFVLATDSAGGVVGVRSTNGAPFQLYTGATDARSDECPPPAAPPLGCGADVHGITFDFDSAVLREESAAVLDAIAAALAASDAAEVTITGHTSSDGSEEYNRALSERRAQSVVAALTARGIAAGRLRASGAGESQPIADNTTEAGRSLNRRVHIGCR